MVDSGTSKMRTDMKKTFKFFAAALAIVAAASCAKEISNDNTDIAPEQELVHKVFSASLNVDPETKTTLHTDGVTVHWTEGDRIAVIPASSSSANNFSVVSIDGTFADFEGETVDADSYRAVYPAAAFHGWSTASTFTFSNGEYALKNQYAVENDFSVAAAFNCSSNFAVSTTSKDEHLYFQNINAYLKVSLEMDNAAVIEVTADKVVGSAGNLTASYDLGGSLNYRVATGEVYMSSNHSIVFKSEDGSNLKSGVNYYIAIPTVKMSGLTMTVKDADGEALVAFTKTAEFTPVANTIYNLGKMAAPETDINPDFSASHVFENNILTGTQVTMTLPADDVSKISNVKVQIKNGGTVYRTIEKSTIATSEVLSVSNNYLYLPKGSYEAVVTYNIAGLTKSMTAYLTVPQVSGLAVSATKTPYTSYSKYKSGAISEANNSNGKSLYNICYTVNISQEVLNKTPLSEARIRIIGPNYVDKDGSKTSKDFYSVSELSGLDLGNYRTIQAIATFDDVQFFIAHTLTDCHITGLPYRPTVSEIGFSSLTGTTTKDFYPSIKIPSSVNVSVNTNVTVQTVYDWGANKHTFEVKVNDADSGSKVGPNVSLSSKSETGTISIATTISNSTPKITMSVSESKSNKKDPTSIINSFEMIYR